ncbi:MAG TPA: preprotein translocase subunit SecE [Clostridiaceae bacterium]|nr:preprotein translocase subunit SecE [Clostridiaceae bacterium]
MASKKRKGAATRDKKSAVDRDNKGTKRAVKKKDAKPSLFARLKKWFINIINELKRVVWPDKKKLKQSTLTVLLIIAISTVMILVFDSLISFILRTTGFYSSKASTSETVEPPAITETAETAETEGDAESTATTETSNPSESVEATTESTVSTPTETMPQSTGEE